MRQYGWLLLLGAMCISAKGLEWLEKVQDFTVYTQISPHTVDVALESSLEKCLAAKGTVVKLDRKKEDAKVYEALANPVFIKLALSNWMLEKDGKLSVQVHLTLECTKRAQSEQTWVVEEDFAFTEDPQILIERGTQAIKKLTGRFCEEYQKVNPKGFSSVSFFVL